MTKRAFAPSTRRKSSSKKSQTKYKTCAMGLYKNIFSGGDYKNMGNDIIKFIKKDERNTRNGIGYRWCFFLSIVLAIILLASSYVLSTSCNAKFIWLSNALLSISVGLITGLVFFSLSNAKNRHKEQATQTLNNLDFPMEYGKRLVPQYMGVSFAMSTNLWADGSCRPSNSRLKDDFDFFKNNYERFLNDAFEASRHLSAESIQVEFREKSVFWSTEDFQNAIREALADDAVFKSVFEDDLSELEANKKLAKCLVKIYYFCDGIQRKKRMELGFNVNSLV